LKADLAFAGAPSGRLNGCIRMCGSSRCRCALLAYSFCQSPMVTLSGVAAPAQEYKQKRAEIKSMQSFTEDWESKLSNYTGTVAKSQKENAKRRAAAAGKY
jgi:hypothetical protein